jgi:hypothetical protein
LLPRVRAGSFLGGDEPRAEVDADRAQHQRRRDAASVENTAGGDNGDRRYGIDDLPSCLRYWQSGAESGKMPAPAL